MTDPAPLPALPEPEKMLCISGRERGIVYTTWRDAGKDYYTADQMHAYAQAAIAAQTAPVAQQAAPVYPLPLRIYQGLCDLVEEADALGSVLERPAHFRHKLVRLRDEVGSAPVAAAHAQQPAALTDAQIIELSVDCYDSSHTNPLILFARAIERAHGIPAPTTDTGMSMDYIRSVYNVPAKRGGRVEYTHPKPSRFGTIVRADGARLRIRLDGDKHADVYHPTWELRYLPEPNTGEG